MKRAWAMVLAIGLVSPALAVPLGDEKVVRPPAVQVRVKLLERVSLPEVKPETPLRDALLLFAARFDLHFLVDTEAFARDVQLLDPESNPVSLPEMKQVQLRTVLRLLLARSWGDFFVRPDGVIQIVPRVSLVACQLKQRVDTKFDGMPLQGVLCELQVLSGFSIVLDVGRAGDKAKAPITADVSDTTVEASVLIVADLAGLKPVLIDNVYYVTTPDHAAKLQKEQDAKRAAEEKSQLAP